ncbi:peptidoglycan D,D-transpeptidase FtsI family protein [Clostridium formicaceticum]|uniref:Penicillin-binding protein 4B n=1 Tax=Clostridium formicaceticum TaxID=1497 RepID=A0AAC9WG30_9CLOT|nr:penicillin-binding protein 2 [Clostridium formicaceticum]AOY77037.1 hypothetical protein BJL90_14970 [Clostridium formicaceticum]ARE87537.1 Penicillin-binding protein 4B [Clostridium formicaceticum]
MRRAQKKEKKKELVYIKRLWFIGIVSTMMILLLMMRLFYIQVMQYDFYLKEVNKQRQINIPINSGRGMIFDRNLIPLTEREEEKVVVIFPQLFIPNEENLGFLSEITGEAKDELSNRINQASYPIEISIAKEIDWGDRRVLGTRGLFVIGKRQRYENFPLLTHVIGYINQVDKKGMAGIEKALDPILMGSLGDSLVATLDGRKRFLPGEGFSVASNTMKQNDIRLTIDYHLQKVVEEVIDQHKKNGAIILSDIETGEILALVSRPNYNPNTILKHINSSGDELYNKAIQMTFPPGSVFKIVVAAEAIEKGAVALDDVFYCSGSEEIGSIEIKCNAHDKGGNEEITFERAFAESCNSTFIQLGQRLGAENLMEMAKNLGLGEVVGIGLLEEEKGSLPAEDHLLGPAIGNISIGQGDIEVTPLQINQLTQIIANNGIKQPLVLLRDILDNYTTVQSFETKENKRVLSEKTAKTLQQMMHSVMTVGTGRNIGELASITAGKTGTAQSSQKGKSVLHAWFTGYYPVNHPKYAITVLIQEGGSGGRVAVPIFKEILEKMIYLGYYK